MVGLSTRKPHARVFAGRGGAVERIWAAEMPHEIETFRVARARRHSMKDVYFLLTRFSPPLRDNGGDPAANEAGARNQGEYNPMNSSRFPSLSQRRCYP